MLKGRSADLPVGRGGGSFRKYVRGYGGGSVEISGGSALCKRGGSIKGRRGGCVMGKMGLSFRG